MRKSFAFIAAALALVMASVMPGLAQDGTHRVALQISDNDAQKMNTVLNVAANVSRYYSDKGESVEIQVVAFNAGLHMLRSDTSPVAERVSSFVKSMPNVTFDACNNTIQGMTKKEGKEPPLIEGAVVVPSGAVTLIDLSENGWTILRP